MENIKEGHFPKPKQKSVLDFLGSDLQVEVWVYRRSPHVMSLPSEIKCCPGAPMSPRSDTNISPTWF